MTRVLMGLLAISLIGVIGWEITGTDPSPSMEVARYAPPATLPPSEPSPDHQRAFVAVNARPLFNPDRRPVASALTGLPRLTGIIVVGDRRAALFAGAKPLTAGERVGNYRIQLIGLDGVTVMGPDGVSTVRPTFDPAPPIKPPPTGAARPPIATVPAPASIPNPEVTKQFRPNRPTLTRSK